MTKKGFTLIELLVVVAIIGMLASIVITSMSEVRASARDAKRIQEIKELQKALELYAINHNGEYPQSDNGPQDSTMDNLAVGNVLSTTLNELVSEGYIGKIPIDPINLSSYEGKILQYTYRTDANMSCGNVVDNYKYIITFNTENPINGFSIFTAQSLYGYCLTNQ